MSGGGDDAADELGCRLPASRPGVAMLVAGSVVTAILLGWFTLQYFYSWSHPVLGWFLLPASPTVAALATARAGDRTDLPRSVQRFWRHFSWANWILAVGVLSNATDALFGDRVGGQRTQLLYLAGVLLVMGILLRLPGRRRTRREWLPLGLDLTIVATATGLVGWSLGLHYDIELAATTDALPLGVVLLGVAGVVVAVKLCLTGAGKVNRRALGILGGSIAVCAIVGSGAARLATHPDLDLVMLAVPLVCFGNVIAAHQQLRMSVRHRARRRWRTGRSTGRRGFSLLPYLAIAGTDALLLVTADDASNGTLVMIAGSVGLTGLVIGRQILAFRDNARLLSQVDASLLELRHHEERFRSLVQNSDDVISIIDASGRLTYVSPGLRRVLGVEPDAWLGHAVADYVHHEDRPAIDSAFARLRGTPGGTVRGDGRMIHADGSWRWMEVTLTNLVHDPSVRGVVANARDITKTRQYQNQLAYQVSHDDLTGLANRSLFTVRIARAVRQAQPGTVAVALVDLDDFKTINDRLGHAVGDALLMAVGARLRACIRPEDTVARLGGDEFAVLLTDLKPGESGEIAERIVAALAPPVLAADHDLLIQASIGLSDNMTATYADDLLRRADLAMYAAKELGKNRYVHYNDEMEQRAVEHAQLAAELSQALDRNEFHLLYQPIVDLPGGRVVGAEALVRWVHPRDGLISPAKFIPVAERTGLIVPLGAWVLRTACRQAAMWHLRHGDQAPHRISVNVSARQLLDSAFPQDVAKVLNETGLAPERLTVEITETAVFGGGRAVETVTAVHSLGVSIALDDFGTGHSSLGLLRACPVDVLKVDKSFIDGVTGTVEQEAIATSIIEIAQALGMRAIAEGVETGAQADRLHSLGYGLAQGFHFAKPLRPQDLERLFLSGDRDDHHRAA